MPKAFDPPLSIKEIQNYFSSFQVVKSMQPGGQGGVFKVLTQDKIEAALKIYSPHQLVRRAELEVKKLSKINSDYIVKLIDYGTSLIRGEQCFYSLTQFIPGVDLKDRFKKGVLNESEAVYLICCVGQAIDDMWKARVVHCDIKPSNIMYLEKNKYMVIDLGIAKHLDEKTFTAAGMILGTPSYMAPEQLLGRKNLTLRVDLFALGLVAYEALTGKHPFNHNPLLIANTKPISISRLTKIKRELAEAIDLLLETDSVNRPISGQRLIEMIKG